MGLNFTINNELVVPYSRYMQGFCFKQTLITFLLMGRLPSVHRLWSLYHNGFNSLWSGNSLKFFVHTPLAFTSDHLQYFFRSCLRLKIPFRHQECFFHFWKKNIVAKNEFSDVNKTKKYQRWSGHSLRFQVWYFEWNKWRKFYKFDLIKVLDSL